MIVISYPERILPERRLFDQDTSEFIIIPEMHLKPMKLKLEHSLMSIRNWESEHETPFSEIEKMTPEDLIGYIKCMTINRQEDDSVYDQLTAKDLERVSDYIAKQNSAWEIRRSKGKKPKQKQDNTVEGIYYTMIQLGIPIDPCEQWHLGSLLALIDYFGSKGGGNGGKEKKKTWREMQEQWIRMNEANRKKFHSRG